MAKFKADRQIRQFAIVGMKNKKNNKVVLFYTNLPKGCVNKEKSFDTDLPITEGLIQAAYQAMAKPTWEPIIWGVKMRLGYPKATTVREYRFQKGIKKGDRIPPSSIWKQGFPAPDNGNTEIAPIDFELIKDQLNIWGIEALPQEESLEVSFDPRLSKLLEVTTD